MFGGDDRELLLSVLLHAETNVPTLDHIRILTLSISALVSAHRQRQEQKWHGGEKVFSLEGEIVKATQSLMLSLLSRIQPQACL